MTINEIQDKIIEEFSALNDGFEKYKHLVNLGKSLEPLKPEIKTEENLINGCQSQVWLKADIKDGKVQLIAGSDALITKGIISLLLRVVNNQSAADIFNCELYFIDRIGLNSNLSPARGNGLFTMVRRVKTFAGNNYFSP